MPTQILSRTAIRRVLSSAQLTPTDGPASTSINSDQARRSQSAAEASRTAGWPLVESHPQGRGLIATPRRPGYLEHQPQAIKILWRTERRSLLGRDVRTRAAGGGDGPAV